MRHHPAWVNVVVVVCAMVLGGCGGGDDGGAAGDAAAVGGATPTADAARAVRQWLPEHNPDARYGGKTVLEYAEGLIDLNPEVQLEALMFIGEFGVDGLPAREQVRDLVNNPRADEMIRLFALGVLHEMQAPEATPLAREKLADPEFSNDLDTYADLISGLVHEAGIDTATIRTDLLAIARADLDHATRLMMLDNVPEEAHEALVRAVFEADHNERARDYFVQNLAGLTMLGDEPRLNYVVGFVETDPGFATQLMTRQQLPAQAQQALTRAVFESDHNDQARDYLLNRFAQLDFIDEEARIAYMDRLVETDFERAAQLMMRRTLPDAFQTRLVRAILAIRDASLPVTQTHNDQIMVFFFQQMAHMDFLEPDEKFQFVADNSAYASRPNIRPHAHRVLLSVATPEAMRRVTNDLVMNPPQKYQMMIQFAQAGVDPIHVFDEMLRDFNESTQEDSISQTGAYLDLLTRQIGARTDEGRALEAHFITTMSGLITEAESPVHGAIAALYLVNFAKEAPEVSVLRPLEAVFAVLGNTEAPDVVRGTAGEQLKAAANALFDRPGFVDRTVQALWEGQDINATLFPEEILIEGVGRNADRVKRVIRSLVRDVDDHLNDWSINPAGAVLLQIGGIFHTRNELAVTPEYEQLSFALAKIFVSPHANQQYLSERGEMYRMLYGAMLAPGMNTVDGMIALYDTFMFSDEGSVLHGLDTPALANSALGQARTGRYVVAQGPEAVATWRAFLERGRTQGMDRYQRFVERAQRHIDTATR